MRSAPTHPASIWSSLASPLALSQSTSPSVMDRPVSPPSLSSSRRARGGRALCFGIVCFTQYDYGQLAKGLRRKTVTGCCFDLGGFHGAWYREHVMDPSHEER